MDLNQPKPRIDGSMLAPYDGKIVTLLGKVKTVDSNGVNILVEASDKTDVKIMMQDPLQEMVQGLIEIHGVVQDDHIVCFNYVLFAPENEQTFNMENYNTVVTYINTLSDHYIQGSVGQEPA